MDEITLLRYMIILFALAGIVLYILFYRRSKKPIVIPAMIWLINLVAFSIFRLFTGSGLEHYFAVTTWSSISNLLATVLLLSAAIIFFPTGEHNEHK